MHRGTFEGPLAVRSISKAPRCAPLRLPLSNCIRLAIHRSLKTKGLTVLALAKSGRNSIFAENFARCGSGVTPGYVCLQRLQRVSEHHQPLPEGGSGAGPSPNKLH